MSTPPLRDAARSPEAPAADEPAAECHGPLCDLLTAAVVFAILGGLFALWLADLSLVTGGLAALAAGAGGVLFAKG